MELVFEGFLIHAYGVPLPDGKWAAATSLDRLPTSSDDVLETAFATQRINRSKVYDTEEEAALVALEAGIEIAGNGRDDLLD